MKISTNPPPGMRDFLADDMIKREFVVNKIKSIFETFGFEPWETPAVERLEVLQGKYGEEEKLIYKFQDLGGTWLAMRYDLTVPLARVVARFPQLPKPIKRYHISRVWRYERKQKGRYKEFWQCDADIVGSSSMLADAEVLALVPKVFKSLGFENFTVKVNNRKILDAWLRKLGIKDKKTQLDVLHSIDKLDKVGLDGVEKELVSRGINKSLVPKILDWLKLEGSYLEALESVEKFLGKDEEGLDGVNELREIYEYLEWFGVDRKNYVFSLSLVRGLDYYTGPIYEVVVEKPKIGTLAAGGRYDRLIGLFHNKDLPAVGISFGIERIIDVMDEFHMFNLPKTKVKVFVANAKPELLKEAVKLAEFLRSKGVSTQTDLMGRNLKKQMEYADSKGIPYVAIVAPKELQQGKYVLKDMVKKTEIIASKEEILKTVKETG